MTRQLDIATDLQIDADGEPIHIQGDGSEVVVEFESARGMSRALLQLPAHLRRSAGLERLNRLLADKGLTVSLNSGSRTLLRLGQGSQSGSVARLLKLMSAEAEIGDQTVVTVRDKSSRSLLWAGAAALGAVGLYIWLRR